MQTLRIAAAMLRTPVGRTEANLAAVARWTRRARQAGARLVCFPELTLTGYTTRHSLTRHALAPAGPVAASLSELARQEGITLLVGAAEPGPEGRLFAAHWVARPGRPLAAYRKTHIAPPESALLAPGDQVPVFEAAGIRFGIQLCYDGHFPELSAHMAFLGAEVIFFPHASPKGTPTEKRDSWMRHLTARAFDNSVFVVACNQTGDNGAGLSFPGTAVVIGPAGDVIAEDTSGAEGLLVADLDAGLLDHVRGHRMRHFFPHRRLDLYRRLLRRQCRSALNSKPS
jgi:N-carbamoylputrescine amidase